MIDAPIDLVFRALADAENYSKAVPDIVEVEFLEEQQSGVGTRFRETRVLKGREVEFTLVMDARLYRFIQKIVTPLICKLIAGAVEADLDALKVYCKAQARKNADRDDYET